MQVFPAVINLFNYLFSSIFPMQHLNQINRTLFCYQDLKSAIHEILFFISNLHLNNHLNLDHYTNTNP